MNILVIGGAGFVGSHIVSALLANGHQVTIGGRGYFNSRFPKIPCIPVNFKDDTSPDVWKPRLQNIDAVVNCIGILHDRGSVMDCVHTLSPKALFTACQQTGIKHVVQISAKGTELERGIPYNDSKKAADDFLKELNISATIIRPSYVYSHGSYGGSSLFRGLASVPFILPVVGKGDQVFRPILAEEVGRIVVNRIETAEAGVVELAAVGPEAVNNLQLLKKTRAWLGFGKGLVIRAPMAVIGMVSLVGNLVTSFPINRTTYGMMKIPDVAAGTAEEFDKLVATTGIKPKAFSQVLAENPSFVQDRWHARLYLLKPLIRIVLALMWLASALVGYLLPESTQVAMQIVLPFSAQQFAYLMHISIGADVVIGLLVLFNWRPVWLGFLQLIVIIGYTLFISIWLPSFWLHPFGPLIKNIPILLLILVHMAIASDR